MRKLICIGAATIFSLSQSPPAWAQNALEKASARSSGHTVSSQYIVAGLHPGGRAPADSQAYRQFKCSQSKQFPALTYCQRRASEREPRGAFTATYSMLHDKNGTLVYINRFLEPAFFRQNEASADIDRLTRRFGMQPRILKIERRGGVHFGIIASWGDVVLEVLDSDSMDRLAAGKPLRKGYLVDYIGNYSSSAKLGLPVYALHGGAGFVWAASYNESGRGTLRFAALNASAFATPTSDLGLASLPASKEAAAPRESQSSSSFVQTAAINAAMASAQIPAEPLRECDTYSTQTRNLEEAIAACEKAVLLNREEPRYALQLGHAYQAAGRGAEAGVQYTIAEYRKQQMEERNASHAQLNTEGRLESPVGRLNPEGLQQGGEVRRQTEERTDQAELTRRSAGSARFLREALLFLGGIALIGCAIYTWARVLRKLEQTRRQADLELQQWLNRENRRQREIQMESERRLRELQEDNWRYNHAH